mmetsp:Transcript_83531/g.231691  ORF Transcript_83531/g.231691 Transcript_83531/m.231691 type:complete len:141 (+) Transcript_83531:263-685(+)
MTAGPAAGCEAPGAAQDAVTAVALFVLGYVAFHPRVRAPQRVLQALRGGVAGRGPAAAPPGPAGGVPRQREPQVKVLAARLPAAALGEAGWRPCAEPPCAARLAWERAVDHEGLRARPGAVGGPGAARPTVGLVADFGAT